ncbi:MAG: hypothetical protein QF463_15915 [Vicinamibacterales bacterium]|jgi:hypothetical protein|nr:hypothetical protein [Acidobacteriota bacterium]MDP6371624.1 hypothetical protein [Vicinamibacterales bacterium]MDP6610551.1 hypothetical protein [Vicinamibacterales bacterium]HAK56313.1 hypothetical protein [Acidobacteriota bacterium]
MKKLTLLALAALLVMPSTVLAQQRTVEGELVDSLCTLGMGASGEGHKECAIRCATAGFPVGVMTADGEHLALLSPADAFKDYMALQIRVTGNVNAEAATIAPTKVEANQDGTWVELSLPAMPM